MLGSKALLPLPLVLGLAMLTLTLLPQMSCPSAARQASKASSFFLKTTKAKQGTLLAIQISTSGPNLLKTSSRSHLLALLSRSATWSLCPSISSDCDPDLDLLRPDRDLRRRLRNLLLGEGEVGLSLDLLDLTLPVLDLVLADPGEAGGRLGEPI